MPKIGQPLPLARLNIKSTLAEVEFFRANPGSILGIPTGIRKLDEKLGGLVPGRTIMIVARPGVGKTTAALNFALNAAQGGKRVSIFEMEMSEPEIVKRLASIQCGIPEMAIRTGYFYNNGDLVRLEPEHYTLFTDAITSLADMPIRMHVGGITTDQVYATLEHFEGKVDLAIIDHVGLFTDHAGLSQYQRMTYVSRAIKDLRMRFDVPLLVVAQLNRGTEGDMRKDKRPVLSDIRDTGALEQDADQVIAVYREDYGSSEEITKDSKTELIVLKNRYGPTETVFVHMSLATGKIYAK